jgi:factor VIII intron 22 protein
LAQKFDNSYLSEYAGLCFLGCAKCNEPNDFDSYLKAARCFRKADERISKLGSINSHNLLEGAHRSYFQALDAIEDDSVMKTCIIREMRELNKNLNLTSDFNSASHRIHDLEVASNDNIMSRDFIGALEKLTEIVDDITERKETASYSEVMKRNEINRLLLLLLLELPPSRQSPSSLKLVEKYSWNNESFDLEIASLMRTKNVDHLIDEKLTILLEGLVFNCQNSFGEGVKEICNEIEDIETITKEQSFLLVNLIKKYSCC